MAAELKLESKWTKIENVFELLEVDGRKLTPGEKDVIAGQRIINRNLYQAIIAILGTFPDEAAPQAIKDARNLIADLPGNEPPGCCEFPHTVDCKPTR